MNRRSGYLGPQWISGIVDLVAPLPVHRTRVGGRDVGEEPSQICGRDRAVLRAVAAGRCELPAGCEPELVVDGVRCADSAVAQRLIAAGLVVKPVGSAVARLTPAGRAAARTRSRPDPPGHRYVHFGHTCCEHVLA